MCGSSLLRWMASRVVTFAAVSSLFISAFASTLCLRSLPSPPHFYYSECRIRKLVCLGLSQTAPLKHSTVTVAKISRISFNHSFIHKPNPHDNNKYITQFSFLNEGLYLRSPTISDETKSPAQSFVSDGMPASNK